MSDHPVRPERIIRASELSQYSYCKRAWWLSAIKGAPSSNTPELESGQAAHRRHGRTVWLAAALRWMAIGLAVAAILIGVAVGLK